MKHVDIFDLAEELGTEVFYGDIPQCKSISVPDNICLDFSLLCGGKEEHTRLAHELGHCATGAFYNRYTVFDVIERQEWKADKWAVHQILPIDSLRHAVESGVTTVWELADKFCVTEDFILRTLEVYKAEGKL